MDKVKLVIGVVILGLTIFYGGLLSQPRTVEYTDLKISIEIPKNVYSVNEEINATVYLENPYLTTVLVEPFSINFVSYTLEGSHPALTELGIGSPTIEIPGNSRYKVKSQVFKASKSGIYVINFNGHKETLSILYEAGRLDLGAPVDRIEIDIGALVYPAGSIMNSSLEDLIANNFIKIQNYDEINTTDFNVSAFKAVEIALNRTLLETYYIQISPRHFPRLENRTRLNGTFWVVHLYHDPPEEWSGKITEVIIDKNGKIIEVSEQAWFTTP